MARKQLEPFMQHTASNRSKRARAPVTPIYDMRAAGVPKGVISADVVVRDPYPDANGEYGLIRVTRNIRGDTLGALHSRRQIEQHQYDAGREWQRHYLNAEIGGIKAADPTKEPVDGGGGVYDVLTDKQRLAVRKLARADAALGIVNRQLIIDVIGKGMSIDVASEVRCITTVRGKLEIGKQLRSALDILAVTFGLAMRGI